MPLTRSRAVSLDNFDPRMLALGHSRRFHDGRVESAFPPIATVALQCSGRRFVPGADIAPSRR